MAKIEKLLVANRGEIAVRIISTAKHMAIKTVAVYSEADRDAPHVVLADEAFFLGPSPSADSYLRMDKIIAIAKEHKVDAIHPGYGFLSENPQFAEALEAEGIILVGPSAHAMRIMGSKLDAKAAVKSYDIPMVPGTDHAIASVQEAKEVAAEIGYPILIKASAGGGGKGMRIVQDAKDLEANMERAISEAVSAFGDGAVFIEKYIEEPRHIEIQVLFDQHGNGVFLHERECSIQRRHQKVIEEAPSANMPDQVRQAMGAVALQVGQACKYTGAGTVEFLMDQDYNFYFLEMNTRLQVEHPVTELICGIDLVEEQILVAEGHKLRVQQDAIPMRGHAIELRIYAEDPMENFAPSIGDLEVWSPPTGPGIRLDSGYRQGQEVPIYYDPMLAKLVVHAQHRRQAIKAMSAAIDAFEIKGIESTLTFGAFVMQHPTFVSGKYSTHFVQRYFDADKLSTFLSKDDDLLGQLAFYFYQEAKDTIKLIN